MPSSPGRKRSPICGWAGAGPAPAGLPGGGATARATSALTAEPLEQRAADLVDLPLLLPGQVLAPEARPGGAVASLRAHLLLREAREGARLEELLDPGVLARQPHPV